MDKVVHFEIPADDLGRAKKFYTDNFDWKLNQLGPEMNDYVLVQTAKTDEQGMIQEAGAINGGMMRRDKTSSSPVLVIQVDSAEKTLEKIKQNGGEVISEVVEIPNIGFYARFKDTEGNVVGVLGKTK